MRPAFPLLCSLLAAAGCTGEGPTDPPPPTVREPAPPAEPAWAPARLGNRPGQSEEYNLAVDAGLALVAGRLVDGATGRPLSAGVGPDAARIGLALADPAGTPGDAEEIRTAGGSGLTGDGTGHFFFRVPPGPTRWRVTAAWEDGRGFRASTPPFAVELPGADVGDVKLFRGPTLTGTVLAADGAPADGVLVLPAVDAWSAPAFEPALTDADGRFAVAVLQPYRGIDREPVVRIEAFALPSDAVASATVPLPVEAIPPPVTLRLAAAPVPPPPEPAPNWRKWFRPGDRLPPAPGEPAPEWEVSAAWRAGAPVPTPDLADYRGRWVLLRFVPFPSGSRSRREANDAPAAGPADVRALEAAYPDRLAVIDVFPPPQPGTGGWRPLPGARAADHVARHAPPRTVLEDVPIADFGRFGATAWLFLPGFGSSGRKVVLIDPAGRVRLHATHAPAAAGPRLADSVRRFLAEQTRRARRRPRPDAPPGPPRGPNF